MCKCSWVNLELQKWSRAHFQLWDPRRNSILATNDAADMCLSMKIPLLGLKVEDKDIRDKFSFDITRMHLKTENPLLGKKHSFRSRTTRTQEKKSDWCQHCKTIMKKSASKGQPKAKWRKNIKTLLGSYFENNNGTLRCDICKIGNYTRVIVINSLLHFKIFYVVIPILYVCWRLRTYAQQFGFQKNDEFCKWCVAKLFRNSLLLWKIQRLAWKNVSWYLCNMQMKQSIPLLASEKG